MTACS